MIQPLPFKTTLSPSSSATNYNDLLGSLAVAWTTVEADVVGLIASAGTLRNFNLRIDVPPTATSGKSWAWTVRLNGADTALTGTIADTATSVTVSGVDVTVAEGDRITIKCVPSGTPDAFAELNGSLEFESDVAAQSTHGGRMGLIIAATLYSNPFAPAQASSANTTIKGVVAAPGSITKMFGRLDSAPGATAGVRYYLNKNGTRQDGSGGTVNTEVAMIATTSGSATFTLPVVAGDVIYVELVPAAGGGGTKQMSIGMQFTATNDGESNLCGCQLSMGTNAAARYFIFNVHGTNQINGAAVSATQDINSGNYGGPTTYTLRDPQYLLENAPAVGKSRTWQAYRNGGLVGPTVTISDNATTGSATGSFTVRSGQLASLQHTSSGTPTASTLMWGWVLEATTELIANDDAYTTPFETTLTVPAAIGVLLNDDPSTGVTAVLVDDVTDGTLSLSSDGSFTYTPDAAFSGTDTFTYYITDGTLDSNVATVTITVTALTIPPAGTNPPYAEIPTDVPLLFMELKVGATATAYAETPLNDNATWTRTVGTPYRKGPKILRVSSIRRELTQQGGFGTSQVTVELSDEDREFRTLCANATITNSYCGLYIVDDGIRRSEGEPFRVFAGVVAEHRALPGFRYELTIEDALGAYFGNAFEQPQIPPHVLTVAEFSGMDPSAEGTPGPIGFGVVSDSSASSPQGAAPMIFMGTGMLSSISGHSLATNTMVAAFMGVEHACRSVSNYFYNHPDSPTLRHAIDNSAFGTLVWGPHKPNWSSGVGWSHNYIDFGSPARRYTPLFAILSHSLTQAAIDGRTIVSFNFAGQDSTGDGTGVFYSQPERMLAQLLLNYVFSAYQAGSFINIPFFTANSYTVYDTDTLDACESIGANRMGGSSPYTGGVLLGANGQENGYDLMREFSLGGDFETGTNRHGQLIWSRDYVSATPTMSYTAQGDILGGSFEMWTDRTDYANKLAYRYEERYLPPSAPLPTPSIGAPLPRESFKDYAPWVSSIGTLINTPAIAAYNSRTVLYEFDNRIVRHNSTATNVASYAFNRRIGPRSDGGWRFRFSTGLQGYGKGTVRVDLGTTIQFEIPERLGTVATSPVIGYVTSHELDAQEKRVTLEGRVLR